MSVITVRFVDYNTLEPRPRTELSFTLEWAIAICGNAKEGTVVRVAELSPGYGTVTMDAMDMLFCRIRGVREARQ